MTAEFNFPAAPLWEVGLSAVTAGPLLDTYDIKEIHELYRAELPVYQRQAPLPPFQPFPAPGVQAVFPPHLILPTWSQAEPVRYWFLDGASEMLAQVQDNFIGRNWRRVRLEGPPSAPYPGFDVLLARFRDQVQRLEAWNLQRGVPFPPPALCDLLYDNLIEVTKPDGTSWAISDLMKTVKPVGPVLNWTLQWFESVDSDREFNQGADMQITMQMVAQPSVSGGLRNYIKFMLMARSPQQSWDGVFAFLERAHARIRTRFLDLTTEAAHDVWRAH